MKLGLEGKVAIVTGASRGLGRACAHSLAAEGCKLAICARSQEGLDDTAAEIEQLGAEVLAVPLDVTEPEAAGLFVEETVGRFGRIDVLVNNVGGGRRSWFEDTTDEEWDEFLNLNVTSHVRFSRSVIGHMKRQQSGVLIFVSSVYGRESGGRTLSIYNTTKAALISLAKILSVELAPEGIRVLSVAPGSIRFPGGNWDRRSRRDPKGIARFVEQNLPLGRFGSPEEVGDVVTFLASERASLITGACINVDGGQSKSLI